MFFFICVWVELGYENLLVFLIFRIVNDVKVIVNKVNKIVLNMILYVNE